jgi:VanZ family protein
MRLNNFLRYFFLSLTIGLIVVFSFIAVNPLGFLKLPETDKGMHFMSYSLLYVFSYLSFSNKLEHSVKLKQIVCIVFCLLLGVSLEFAQSLFTGGQRDFDGIDILANMGGILIGYLTIKLFTFRKMKLQKALNRKQNRTTIIN